MLSAVRVQVHGPQRNPLMCSIATVAVAGVYLHRADSICTILMNAVTFHCMCDCIDVVRSRETIALLKPQR